MNPRRLGPHPHPISRQSQEQAGSGPQKEGECLCLSLSMGTLPGQLPGEGANLWHIAAGPSRDFHELSLSLIRGENPPPKAGKEHRSLAEHTLEPDKEQSFSPLDFPRWILESFHTFDFFFFFNSVQGIRGKPGLHTHQAGGRSTTEPNAGL